MVSKALTDRLGSDQDAMIAHHHGGAIAEDGSQPIAFVGAIGHAAIAHVIGNAG